MATGNTSFDRLISTTIKKYIPRFEDNIFTSKPLLFALSNFDGGITNLDGGTNIVEPLMYAELANKGSYTGSDAFSTDDDDGFTAAEYSWAQYYALVKLENIELAKNSGAPAVLRIVENEMKRQELSVAEGLDVMFWGDGTGNSGKDWLGMQAIVDTGDPSGGSLGGIPVASNDFWKAGEATSVGSISNFTEIRTRYIAGTEGNDAPTNIFTTDTLYAKIDGFFESSQRFTDPAMADQGFETIMFHRAPITFDRNVPSGEIYFLNLKYIKLYSLAGTWFKQGEWQEPVNQDVRYMKLLLYGQLTCSNRARQQVMSGVT